MGHRNAIDTARASILHLKAIGSYVHMWQDGMSERSKKHHFVPRVLQRQFACEGGRIWYATRNQGSYGAPQLRNMESTFRMKDLYTVLVDGQYSDVVEREFYGGIDNYLGEIIPEVLEAFRRGLTPQFRGEALEEIRQCALAMIRRTPDFSPAIYGTDEERGRDFVDKLISAYLASGTNAQIIESLELELHDPARLRARGRDIRVRATVSPLSTAGEMIREFSIRWAISERRSAFILPSIMSFRIGNGGPTSLANPRVEIWMPISRDLAMVLVRDKFGKVPIASLISRARVREVNEHAMKLSTSIGSHSKLLLESLTGRRAKA